MVDQAEIINTFIAGILSIAGSIGVAYLYVSNENKKAIKKDFKLYLNSHYIENGILKVEELISKYGRTATFALLDVTNLCKQVYIRNQDVELLVEGIELIKEREIIEKLHSRNFDEVLSRSSYMYQFGNIIDQCLIKMTQLFSDLIRQIMDYNALNSNFQIPENIRIAIENDENLTQTQRTAILNAEQIRHHNNVISALINAAGLTDSTVSYFISRMECLKEYLLTNDPEEYSILLELTNDQSLKKFHEDLDAYHHHLLNYINSLWNSSMNQGIAAGTLKHYIDSNKNANPFD